MRHPGQQLLGRDAGMLSGHGLLAHEYDQVIRRGD